MEGFMENLLKKFAYTMPKRKEPTTKPAEDETEAKEAKEVEPKLKQTKKTTKAAPEKTKKETSNGRATRGKSKEAGDKMEEEKSKSTPKKETPKKETPKKETPKKDKMEEEEKPAAKGRGKSKQSGKSDTEEEQPEKKKVVNKGKGAKGKKEESESDAKEEEKEESPTKGKRGRSKKAEDKKESDAKEEKETKKGRGKSKAKKDEAEEKVIVKKVTDKQGEGEMTVTAKIPNNPKKLNRNRSSMENVLDDYVHNTRAIALGDGKIESKEILIASWNVNGLSALLKKDNLHNYMKEVKPEIICLNEIKLTDENCEDLGTKWIPDGYHGYFNCCKIKKGYSGVAIVSKHKPISVKFDLGVKKHDLEGRTITVEFEHFFLVSSYVPNAGDGLVGLPYRTQEWDPDFKNYLGELKQKKHVILCGDLNCAHKEIDIHKPKGNEKSAGFTPQERKEFTALLDSGFVDTFRHFYPEDQKFSYFSARFPSNRVQNKGWRLDYFLIDKEGLPAIKDSTINDKIYGSDHLPIELKFNPNFDTTTA